MPRTPADLVQHYQASARAHQQLRRHFVNPVIGAAAAAFVLAGCGHGPAPALLAATTTADATSVVTAPPDGGLPPWPVPADPALGVKAAGLSMGPEQGMAEHYHAHLRSTAPLLSTTRASRPGMQ